MCLVVVLKYMDLDYTQLACLAFPFLLDKFVCVLIELPFLAALKVLTVYNILSHTLHPPIVTEQEQGKFALVLCIKSAMNNLVHLFGKQLELQLYKFEGASYKKEGLQEYATLDNFHLEYILLQHQIFLPLKNFNFPLSLKLFYPLQESFATYQLFFLFHFFSLLDHALQNQSILLVPRVPFHH